MFLAQRRFALDRNQQHFCSAVNAFVEDQISFVIIPTVAVPPHADAIGDLTAINIKIGRDEDKLLWLTLVSADDSGFSSGDFQSTVFIGHSSFRIDVFDKRSSAKIR